MTKILRTLRKYDRAQFRKASVLAEQKLIFCHYYIQNVKDGIQIRVYKIRKRECNPF